MTFFIYVYFYPPSVYGREVTLEERIQANNKGRTLLYDYWELLATEQPSITEAREEFRFALKADPTRSMRSFVESRKVGDWVFQLDGAVEEPWLEKHREIIETVLDSFSVRLTR